jgi:hypothetical protein
MKFDGPLPFQAQGENRVYHIKRDLAGAGEI